MKWQKSNIKDMDWKRKTVAVGYFLLFVFFALLSGATIVGMSVLAGGYGAGALLIGGLFYFALMFRGMIAFLDDITPYLNAFYARIIKEINTGR